MAKAEFLNQYSLGERDKKFWIVEIFDSYDIKDILKEAGYKFHPKHKSWFKRFEGEATPDALKKEAEFLDPIIKGDVMGRGSFFAWVKNHT